MGILTVYGGPPIDAPVGIISVVDAPTLILISTSIIFIFFLIKKRNRKLRFDFENQNLEQTEKLLFRENDVLMQVKKPAINGNTLPFTNSNSSARFLFICITFAIVFSLFIATTFIFILFSV